MTTVYPSAFLEIQIAFAQRLAALSGQSLAESVLQHTALYRILGLDWSLDPHHPVWQRFVGALRDDGAGIAEAYQVYAERVAQGLIPAYDTSRPHWGCFSYEYLAKTQAIRLHFANLENEAIGPLSSSRRTVRLAELRTMFAQIRQTYPDAQHVKGGSWLYNRVEYLRLFSPQFGVSARADAPHLHARGLWGQFLRHDNHVNEDIATQFVARLTELSDATAYQSCFPYQNLLTEAPISAFYQFYGAKIA